jgi:hypothetical protein
MFRGLHGVHSRYDLHARQTLYTEGFNGFLAASIVTRAEGISSRVGFLPTPFAAHMR